MNSLEIAVQNFCFLDLKSPIYKNNLQYSEHQSLKLAKLFPDAPVDFVR